MIVKQGVILASGLGSRLNSEGKNEPKPLMPIGGMPLLQRVIGLMQKAGVEKIVLVLGYRADQIENFIQSNNIQGVVTVNNPEYNKKNGISLLRASEFIDPEKPFLLSMADHIFSNDFFSEFIKRAGAVFDDADVILSTDRDIEGVFDLDDATKVFTENNAITKIGKDIKAYNAIDTGLFLCRSSIFEELEKIYSKTGDVSISEGMKAIGDKKRFLSADMTGFLWQDVDTPAMKYEAEQRLIDNCISADEERKFFSNIIMDKISKELLLAAFKKETFDWSIIPPLYFIIAIFIAAISIRLEIIWPAVITYLIAVIIYNTTRMRNFIKYSGKKETTGFFSFSFNASIAMIPIIYNTYPVAAVIISGAVFLIVLAPAGGYMGIISNQIPPVPRNLFKTYLSYSFSFFVLTALVVLPIPSLLISLIFLTYLALIQLDAGETD